MEMMTKVAKIIESRAQTGKSLGNAAAKQEDTVQMERKVAAKKNQSGTECGMIHADLEPDAMKVNFDEGEIIYANLDPAVLSSKIAKQKGAAAEAKALNCEELYDVPTARYVSEISPFVSSLYLIYDCPSLLATLELASTGKIIVYVGILGLGSRLGHKTRLGVGLGIRLEHGRGVQIFCDKAITEATASVPH